MQSYNYRALNPPRSLKMLASLVYIYKCKYFTYKLDFFGLLKFISTIECTKKFSFISITSVNILIVELKFFGLLRFISITIEYNRMYTQI